MAVPKTTVVGMAMCRHNRACKNNPIPTATSFYTFTASSFWTCYSITGNIIVEWKRDVYVTSVYALSCWHNIYTASVVLGTATLTSLYILYTCLCTFLLYCSTVKKNVVLASFFQVYASKQISILVLHDMSSVWAEPLQEALGLINACTSNCLSASNCLTACM